jgi:hypothetical protein
MGWPCTCPSRAVHGSPGGVPLQSRHSQFLPTPMRGREGQEGGAHRLYAKTAHHSQRHGEASDTLGHAGDRVPLTMKTVATPPWRTAQARHKSVLNRSFRPPVNCPIARCKVKQWSPFFDEISNARLYPQGLPDDLSGAILIGRTALLPCDGTTRIGRSPRRRVARTAAWICRESWRVHSQLCTPSGRRKPQQARGRRCRSECSVVKWGALHPYHRAIIYFMDRCSWESKS